MYGGKEYIEFLFGRPPGFYPLKSGTSIYDTFKTRVTQLRTIQTNLPQPFYSLTPGTPFLRTLCKEK
jgi:hypothetical protein